jgi:hypothetical protein
MSLTTGTAFVVEGPEATGFHCLASRLRYGSSEPGSGPIVQFYDANDQRFRYIPATEPPVEADGAIDWDNGSGHWHVRSLGLDDPKWVMLPGMSIANLAAFKAWAGSYSYATVGEPVLDFGS